MTVTVNKATAHTLALAFVTLVSLVAGCGPGESGGPQQKQPPLVEVEIIQTGEIARSLDLTAEMAPLQTVQISSTVEGPITFFPWHEGDKVNAGEKVVEISREIHRAEVGTAEAALNVARSKLSDLRAGTRAEEIDKARQAVKEAEQSAAFEQTDLERVRELVETGALPGEELDRIRVRQAETQARLVSARRHLDMLQAGPTRTAVAVQEALVEEAAAQLALARARLDESTIYAPFAGTVTKTHVRPGDLASAKSPLLEMADMNSLVLRFDVPEAFATVVQEGMPLSAEFDAVPGRTLSAEVVRMYPQLDPQTRTRTVEAEMADQVELVPHMFARVSLTIARIQDAVTIPSQAVMMSAAGQPVAYVIENGKAVRRMIDVGIESSARVQVLSGLQAGEKIVITGNEQLKPGMPVRVAGEEKGPVQPSDKGAKPGTQKKGTRQ